MRSTDIYTNHLGIDLEIDGSSLYDLSVDPNLTDINMNAIYNPSLTTNCLLVDADIENKAFNFLLNVEDDSSVTSLIPDTDVPPSNYFQYQWKGTGYEMFTDRFEKGWSAEFILNFNDAVTGTGENILFYMGKTQNLTGQTTQLIDNNFVVLVDDQKRLVFKGIKFEKECECDSPSDTIQSIVKKSVPLTSATGTSKHHLVILFDRNIGLKGEDLIYKGGNIDCVNFPNTRWYDGKKYRMGRIKVYFDGLLKDTIEGVEETIFHHTADPLDHVQGWGLGDETTYPISMDYGLAGSFTGDLVRGRYYGCPLRGDQIKINFAIFAAQYNIQNPLSNC